MSNNIDRKYTFDLDNQPGIRKTPISREEYKQLAEVLGLDPAYVISLEASGKRVLVTAMLQTTDGAKALGGGSKGGYLKHTYEIPLKDELCTPGSIDGSNLEEGE